MKIDRRTDLLIVFVALLALVGLLYTSSRRKETDLMSMPSHGGNNGNKLPVPSQPLGQTDNYAGANGVRTNTYGMQGVKTIEPSTLLPNDSNSQWASLNPQGGGMLKNINLLQAGSLVGINTVGSSLRNANLQVRSEPPNPQGNVGPWNHSTIEPDFVRLPLEIGSMGGKQ